VGEKGLVALRILGFVEIKVKDGVCRHGEPAQKREKREKRRKAAKIYENSR
jgi:hypothetical protein